MRTRGAAGEHRTPPGRKKELDGETPPHPSSASLRGVRFSFPRVAEPRAAVRGSAQGGRQRGDLARPFQPTIPAPWAGRRGCCSRDSPERRGAGVELAPQRLRADSGPPSPAAARGLVCGARSRSLPLRLPLGPLAGGELCGRAPRTRPVFVEDRGDTPCPRSGEAPTLRSPQHRALRRVRCSTYSTQRVLKVRAALQPQKPRPGTPRPR